MTPKARSSRLEVPETVPGREEKEGVAFPVPKAPRRRATRSAHPGVVLMKPDSRNPTWRARCEDPDKGTRVKVRLDPLGAGRNEQTRRAWAIAKAKEIARRRDALALGAPRATGTALGHAVESYFKAHPRLRPRTVEAYRVATGRLLAFAQARRVASTDDLTAEQLTAFRGTLEALGKRAVVQGATRGARQEGAELRSAQSVNRDLRATKTVLTYLRRLGLLPKLTGDGVADSLRSLSVSHDAPDFLRPAQIGALLRAAVAHDGVTFKATREEHAAGPDAPKGTRRYDPIAPFVAVALLTGMRYGEVATLNWSEVDLAAGEIQLTSRTKTKRARTVTLEVSPALATLLAGLAPEDGRAGPVWKLTADQVKAAAKRLAKYGAPPGWSWQALRRTCGTYLTNAPGIFGAASAYRSARQLGHSVAIAERHYLGVVKVAKEATTLEAAMGCEAETAAIVVTLQTLR